MAQVVSNNFLALLIGVSLIVNSLVILSSTFLIYKQKYEIKCGCCDGSSKEISELEDTLYGGTQQKIPAKIFKNTTRNLQYYSRNDWLSQPHSTGALEMQLPVDKVIIGETETENCMDDTVCSLHIMSLQNYQMNSLNYSDIKYNFIIGGDGGVYEGRGWDFQLDNADSQTVFIALVGNFSNGIFPTAEQLKNSQIFIEDSIRDGKIMSNYRLLTKLDAKNELFGIIRNWNNFDADYI